MSYSYEEMKHIYNWNNTHETNFEHLSPIRQKLVLQGKFNKGTKNLPTGRMNYTPFIIFGAGILIGMLLHKK